MSDRRPFTITLLRRDPEHGFWRARVTNGTTIDVDRRHGAWQGEYEIDGVIERREVMPHVAAALQDRVRPLERAEQAAAKAAVS